MNDKFPIPCQKRLSLYEICVAMREIIVAQTSEGKRLRTLNRDLLDTALIHFEDDWIEIEEWTNHDRKTLQDGVRHLALIDEIAREASEYARKLEALFQLRGLKPLKQFLSGGGFHDELESETPAQSYEG